MKYFDGLHLEPPRTKLKISMKHQAKNFALASQGAPKQVAQGIHGSHSAKQFVQPLIFKAKRWRLKDFFCIRPIFNKFELGQVQIFFMFDTC
jgi:hypothetical protein